MISKPTCDNVFEMKFSNSLAIREEKKKETTTDRERNIAECYLPWMPSYLAGVFEKVTAKMDSFRKAVFALKILQSKQYVMQPSDCFSLFTILIFPRFGFIFSLLFFL